MTRVKMNAKHEYEFVANFKVMQNFFKSKKIDKACFPSRQRVIQTHFSLFLCSPYQSRSLSNAKCSALIYEVPRFYCCIADRNRSGTTWSSCNG
jgi:hypothetical protein